MYLGTIAAPPYRCPETETAFFLSAASLSAVAAVGAGFVLTAIIQVLGQRRREELLDTARQRADFRSTVSVTVSFLSKRRREQLRHLRTDLLEKNKRREEKRSTALILLYSALVVLALDGFLFALVSGQESCIKANAEAMISSGVLAVGASSFFCAMAWLLNIYEDRDDGLARLSIGVGYFFPASAVFLLGITAVALVTDYYKLQEMAGRDAPLAFRYLWLYIPIGIAGLVVRAMWFRTHVNEARRKAAISASRLAAGYAVGSMVLLGAAAAIPRKIWSSAIVEWSFLIFFVSVPIIFPIAIIFILLAAMPTGPGGTRRGGGHPGGRPRRPPGRGAKGA